jgi:hypothetical protein
MYPLSYPRHVKNSMESVNTIKSLRAGPEDILVSFNVISLFTTVPIGEALHLLSRHVDEDILRFFCYVLTSSFFSFNSQFYEQTDGVAMGSPLSPVIANCFMEHFKEMALEGTTHKPLCWFHYMDDTIIIWPHGPGKLSEFLDHLNSVHGNIQFTMKTERDGHLPFLDINMYHKPDGSLGRKVYHKPMHTNLYLNSNSQHHPSNKQAVLSKLVHRARSLCDQESLHSELEFLRTTFRQNGYSKWQIQRALSPPARIAMAPEKPVSVSLSLPALHEHDFQLHQQAAVHAHHQVCGPTTEDDPQFPSACEG